MKRALGTPKQETATPEEDVSPNTESGPNEQPPTPEAQMERLRAAMEAASAAGGGFAVSLRAGINAVASAYGVNMSAASDSTDVRRVSRGRSPFDIPESLLERDYVPTVRASHPVDVQVSSRRDSASDSVRIVAYVHIDAAAVPTGMRARSSELLREEITAAVETLLRRHQRIMMLRRDEPLPPTTSYHSIPARDELLTLGAVMRQAAAERMSVRGIEEHLTAALLPEARRRLAAFLLDIL